MMVRGRMWISTLLAEIMRRGSSCSVESVETGVDGREGLRARGQFAGNFKNATPWSARNEISQRILIRLRPGGRQTRGDRSIQIIWPIPSRCDEEGSFEYRRVAKENASGLIRLWTDVSTDEISLLDVPWKFDWRLLGDGILYGVDHVS